MAISIVEKYQSASGKWVVRLTNGEECLFLRFDHDPTLAEVRAAGQAAIDVIIAQRQASRDDGTERMTLTEAVNRYEAGSLTNAQMKTLLEVLVNRLKRTGLV